LVPLASVLSAIGSWDAVFIATATVSIAAGLCAKFVLAPMRKRWIDNTVAESRRLDAATFQTAWTEAPRNSSAQ